MINRQRSLTVSLSIPPLSSTRASLLVASSKRVRASTESFSHRYSMECTVSYTRGNSDCPVLDGCDVAMMACSGWDVFVWLMLSSRFFRSAKLFRLPT